MAVTIDEYMVYLSDVLSFFSLDDVWLASRCASELHSPFAQNFESACLCMQKCRAQPTLYVSSV